MPTEQQETCKVWSCSSYDTIQEVLGRTAYFPLIRHGPHTKRSVQFLYCVGIRCRGNVFTEPLPSSDTHRHRLVGGIYEVHRWDGLRCHDIHTKFHKDWFRHPNLIVGDSQTYRQHCDLSRCFYFFKIRKVGKKCMIMMMMMMMVVTINYNCVYRNIWSDCLKYIGKQWVENSTHIDWLTW
jgi:hypothetical protein